MTNPAEQNATPSAAPFVGASPLDSFGIDLSSLLEGSGSTDASIQSFDGGISNSGGVQAGFGVEASVGAPAGIPEVSAGVSGQVAAENEFDAYGGFNTVELSQDADAGTTDLSMQSGEGGVSTFGGVELGGKFGFDFSPVDGGIPEIDIEAGAEFGTSGGYDVHGGYDQAEIHQDNGGDFLG